MTLSTIHIQIESENGKDIKVSCAGESATDQDVYLALSSLLKKLEEKDIFKAKVQQTVKEEKKTNDRYPDRPKDRDRK